MPPIVTSGLPGRQFVLHADDLGSLGIGSPVFYRHYDAGQVVAYTMDAGGTGVTIKVFINEPFDAYVTGATRFWQASGVDMSLSSDESNCSPNPSPPYCRVEWRSRPFPTARERRSRPRRRSPCSPDQDRAMRPIETEIRTFVMYFAGSLRGLSAGAPVELHGIEVARSRVWTWNMTKPRARLHYPVEVNLYPQRIRGRQARAEGHGSAQGPDPKPRAGR